MRVTIHRDIVLKTKEPRCPGGSGRLSKECLIGTKRVFSGAPNESQRLSSPTWVTISVVLESKWRKGWVIALRASFL
jgi:hypothetical protein